MKAKTMKVICFDLQQKHYMDKFSYAIGLGIGQNLLSMGAKGIAVDDFAQAIKDVLEGNQTAISHQEAREIVNKYFEELEAKMGAAAIEQGKAFLEENKKKLKQLEEEYAAIRERLEIACQIGDLTEYPKVVILAMSRKVIEHLAAKYEKVAKGVSQQMGGKVLNYEAKDILNRGRAEGRREGEEQTKIQIAKKLLALGNDIQSVADLAELPEETVEKLARSMNQTKR